MNHDMNLIATEIMDYQHFELQEALSHLNRANQNQPKRFWLRNAHHHIETTIQPVYSLDEFQPASITFQEKRGSCSQRLACLEGLARARQIATRVRGLWIDGKFWRPRFPLTKHFIPRRILLAWPQFYFDDEMESDWVDIDELFATTQEMMSGRPKGFTNEKETLFDAIEHIPVDFLGKSRQCVGLCNASPFDLSKYVLSDEGFFNTRDEFFIKFYDLDQSWQGKVFNMIYGGRKSS